MVTEESIRQFGEQSKNIFAQIEKDMIGQKEVVENTVIALIAGGNVLLEGVPGVGKTRLVRSLSRVFNLPFSRIQFTPDLMPADVTGTNIITKDEKGNSAFHFEPGPIFANLVLADEINRATPKTQSALLEAMQEHTVTVMGVSRKIVLKTQKTMSEVADAACNDTELLQMRETANQIPIADEVLNFAMTLIAATQPESECAAEAAKKYVRVGSSPRGGQALISAAKVRALLNGRFNVSYNDIAALAFPVLRHRMKMNFEAIAEQVSPDAVIAMILQEVAKKCNVRLDTTEVATAKTGDKHRK